MPSMKQEAVQLHGHSGSVPSVARQWFSKRGLLRPTFDHGLRQFLWRNKYERIFLMTTRFGPSGHQRQTCVQWELFLSKLAWRSLSFTANKGTSGYSTPHFPVVCTVIGIQNP